MILGPSCPKLGRDVIKYGPSRLGPRFYWAEYSGPSCLWAELSVIDLSLESGGKTPSF